VAKRFETDRLAGVILTSGGNDTRPLRVNVACPAIMTSPSSPPPRHCTSALVVKAMRELTAEEVMGPTPSISLFEQVAPAMRATAAPVSIAWFPRIVPRRFRRIVRLLLSGSGASETNEKLHPS
jgi:hypothetical protein